MTNTISNVMCYVLCAEFHWHYIHAAKTIRVRSNEQRKMLHFLSLQNFELCDSFTLLHHSPSAKFSACFLAFISTLYCNNIDAADAAADFSLLFILGYDRTITSI